MNKELEFDYYLDAWLWCRINGVKFNSNNIKKKDFKTWVLAIPSKK